MAADVVREVRGRLGVVRAGSPCLQLSFLCVPEVYLAIQRGGRNLLAIRPERKRQDIVGMLQHFYAPCVDSMMSSEFLLSSWGGNGLSEHGNEN